MLLYHQTYDIHLSFSFSAAFSSSRKRKKLQKKSYIPSRTRGMLMHRGPPRPRESSEEGISWTVMP